MKEMNERRWKEMKKKEVMGEKGSNRMEEKDCQQTTRETKVCV
jgi:hypothetical protein